MGDQKQPSAKARPGLVLVRLAIACGLAVPFVTFSLPGSSAQSEEAHVGDSGQIQNGTGEAGDTGPGPASGSWRKLEGPGRIWHAAARLKDGRVLIAGGCRTLDPLGNCREPLRTAEVFDPKTARWSPAGQMTAPRSQISLTLLPNGKVLALGGHQPVRADEAGNESDVTADLYDPQARKWARVKFLRNRQITGLFFNHQAVLMPAGPRSVCGRVCGQVVVLGSGFSLGYDPVKGRWRELKFWTGSPLRYPQATLLPSGRIFLSDLIQVFGETETGARIYEPRTNTWTTVPGSGIPRGLSTATELSGGKILFSGGLVKSGLEITSTAEVFDSAAVTGSATGEGSAWRPVENMKQARFAHSATRLKGGKILVVAGSGPAPGEGYPPPSTPLASAEIYDPESGRWSSAGSLSVPRQGATGRNTHLRSGSGHTATLLEDGRVLVAGGSDEPVSEIYTPDAAPAHDAATKESPARRVFAPYLLGIGLLGLGMLSVAVLLAARSRGRRLRRTQKQ